MKNKKDSGFRHIFGPVPSRRLGLSLGVDMVPPKTCTLDCVYCECGRTTRLTIERQAHVALPQIKAELEAFWASDPVVDFITFSGAGEPTLHSGLGEIVGFIKSAYPQTKLALLTNGTLLDNPDVREEVRDMDVVKVSLDAVSENNFKRINRPHRGLNLSNIVDGIAALKKTFSGQLWIEVFLIPGCNDSEVELKEIRNTLKTLAPNRIQLNTLDRPGTEDWVKPADKKTLTKVAAYLYNAEIIKHFKQGPNDRRHNRSHDYDGLLLETIKRRPCTVRDVARLLGVEVSEARRHLNLLITKGVIIQKKMPRGIFYLLPS